MAMLEEKGLAGKSTAGGRGMSGGPGASRGNSPARGQNQSHKLNMVNRESLSVTGVVDVLAFDVSEVLLECSLGLLAIRGTDLHVNRLTLEKGEVDVAGKIDSMTYSDVGTYRKQGESFFSRLFR